MRQQSLLPEMYRCVRSSSRVQCPSICLSNSERSHTESVLGNLTSSALPDVTAGQDAERDQSEPELWRTGKQFCDGIGHLPPPVTPALHCTIPWMERLGEVSGSLTVE